MGSPSGTVFRRSPKINVSSRRRSRPYLGMADQEKMSTMNGTSNATQRKPQVFRSISHLAHDAIELGELQIQLLKTDGDRAVGRVRSAIVLAVVALAFLLSSLPVLLLAASESLVAYAQWSRPLALLVAAVTALAVCAIAAAVGWSKVRQSLKSFRRSSEELSRNVAWLKSELRRSGSREPADTVPPPSSVGSRQTTF